MSDELTALEMFDAALADARVALNKMDLIGSRIRAILAGLPTVGLSSSERAETWLAQLCPLLEKRSALLTGALTTAIERLEAAIELSKIELAQAMEAGLS